MDLFELFQRISYLSKLDKRFFYFDLYKKNLFISRSELIEKQNKYLQSLVKHAYNNTLYYRKLFKDYDVNPERIKSKDDLILLPPLTKSLIRKNINSISSSDSYGKRLIQVASGGTTGEQGLIYISPYYMQKSAAFALRSNYLIGWNPSDKWIALRTVMKSSDIRQEISSRFRNKLSRVYPLNALAYNKDFFAIWVAKIDKFRPKIIYGFSSVLLAFAKYLLENKIHLSSIQIAISTSEILIEQNVIEEAFKAKVVNQYGSREILAIGLQIQNASSMIIFDDNVVVNETDSNELIMTGLHSYGFPIINYKIGDKGSLLLEKEYEKNNLPFSQMSLKIGRVTDNFITIGNVQVAASSLITHLTNFKLGIKEQQIIQNNYKKFTVNFVPDSDFNVKFKNIIQEVFTEYFGDDIKIIFNEVAFIPLEKSGKKLMYKRVFGQNA